MSKINRLLKIYSSYLDSDYDISEINNIRAEYFELKMKDIISDKDELEFRNLEDIFFKKYSDCFPNSYKNNKNYDYYIFKNNEKVLFNDLNKLFEFRNEYARNNGFNDYYDYMFIEDNRNYNHKSVLKLRKYVLKYLVPLNNKLKYKDFDYNKDYLRDIKKFINDNYFKKNYEINEIECTEGWHLLYYPYSNKYDIYTKYKNNEKDIFNLTHECGHIYQLIDNKLFDLALVDYSLSEVFSSYSEILCINKINNTILTNNHIKKILEIIISSVATDEFLEYLYKNGKDLDKAYDNINNKYNILTNKKWYNDIKRVKYPYHCIDYAIAYITTLYTYNNVSLENYRNIKNDYYKYNYIDIVKNNYLGNPFVLDTYKKINNIIRGIINED